MKVIFQLKCFVAIGKAKYLNLTATYVGKANNKTTQEA